MSNPKCKSKLQVVKQEKRSAGVGAVVPVFKHKLLRCENIVKISTFNIRILNIIDQEPNLTISAVEHNIAMKKKNVYILMKNNKQNTMNPVMVGYLSIHLPGKLRQFRHWKCRSAYQPSCLKSLNSIKFTQLIIMCTTFNSDCCSIINTNTNNLS